jgi:hypothetical protein
LPPPCAFVDSFLHRANLEALALQFPEVDWNEDEDDTIKPHSREIVMEKCGEQLEEFRETYGGNDEEIVKKKRPAASSSRSSGGGAAKKVKKEAVSVDQAAKDGEVGVCVCVYVCMYACMYVRCLHVCM